MFVNVNSVPTKTKLQSFDLLLLAGGIDYTDTTATHTFIPFSTLTRCTTITINDDSVLEGTEFFFISVSSDDSSVEIPPLATVSITNDDSEFRYNYSRS